MIITSVLLHEISLWILGQLTTSGTLPHSHMSVERALQVQYTVFGGVLMVEEHPREEAKLGFVDEDGREWMVSFGWLLFKVAEGVEGMPFLRERGFERRRGGTVRIVGG
jgi:hypothetical protein